MKRDIDAYTTNYKDSSDFEVELVGYRRQLVLERLQHYSPQRVVELGCGSELQAEAFHRQGGKWDRWTIVEPSREFAKVALERNLNNLEVIEQCFEDSVTIVGSQPPVDMIICSGLLHEVTDADLLLASVVSIMDANTVLHVNVPNSESFHRRLGLAMGLIGSTNVMSGRNLMLQQHRVYNRGSLRCALQRNGLNTIHEGGYFIKPFTHRQMQLLKQHLDRSILDGLSALGRQYPEWASEIFIEACLSTSSD